MGCGCVEAEGIFSIRDWAHACLRCPGVSAALRCGPVLFFNFAAISLRALVTSLVWPPGYCKVLETVTIPPMMAQTSALGISEGDEEIFEVERRNMIKV